MPTESLDSFLKFFNLLNYLNEGIWHSESSADVAEWVVDTSRIRNIRTLRYVFWIS